jgi:PAS domain S-box-containing protein
VGREEKGRIEALLSKKVLLIANQTSQAHVIRELLVHPSSCEFELAHVGTIDDAENFLARHSVDIVLLDLGTEQPSGLKAFRQMRKSAPRIALVLMVSAEDEPLAMQAIREGAQDYLINCQIEPRDLMRVLLKSAERKKIEEVGFSQEERARATLDSIGDAVICTDASGNISYLNHVAEVMTGWLLKDVEGLPMGEAIRIVDAESHEAILDPMAKAAFQNMPGTLPLNCVLIRRDGEEVSIEDSVAPIQTAISYLEAEPRLPPGLCEALLLLMSTISVT